MPTTPVLVSLWLDPPLQTDFQLGDMVTWHTAFVDRMTRLPVDPDIVNFIYSAPPQLAATTVSALPPVVKDAVGVYRYDLALTLVGKWILTVAALGNPGPVGIGNQSLSIKVFGTGQ